MMKVEWICTGKNEECGVFNEFYENLSGIGPTNALLVETCWDPEIALNVLI